MPTRPAVPKEFLPSSRLFFLIFLAANSLISYSSFSLGAKVGIGFLGLLLPLGLALRKPTGPLARPGTPGAILPPVPSWAWFLLGAAALFIRFFHLTSLSGWPVTDEGWHGFFGLHLMKHWDGSLLYGISWMPAGYFWALAVFFKAFGVSLASLWFLPALLSFLAFLFLSLAARNLFPPSFAFLLSCLAALTYGPFYCGRLSHPGVLAFAWEALCLWIFSGYWKAPRPGTRLCWAAGLGLGLGLGFYSFTSWWSVFALFTAFVLVRGWKQGALLAVVPPFEKGGQGGINRHKGNSGKSNSPFFPPFQRGRRYVPRKLAVENLKVMIGFLAALLLSAGPFWIGAWKLGGSDYFSDLFLFRNKASLSYGWKYALSNATMWFWGADPLGQCYRPVWGGILNPLLGSVFLLGLVGVIRGLKESANRWLVAALGLCLFPGLVSSSVEMYRVLPVLPFLLVVCGFGIVLLFSPDGKKRPARSSNDAAAFGPALFLALSLVLDSYHLFGPYHQQWGTPNPGCADFKSIERWRAFDELQTQAQAQGPGLLFTDFCLKTFDQTLTLAGYSFDAFRNPALAAEEIRWAAVLANPHFVPFLQKRFPGSRWTWLSQGLSRPDGGLSLGVVPLTPSNRKGMQNWISANQAFRKTTLEMIFQTGKRPAGEILGELSGLQPLVKGDPFLESCLWEKVEFHKVLEGDLPGAARALQKGLALGYPNAFFDEQMGLVLWRENRLREAKLYFQKALKFPVNLTPAAQNLVELEKATGGGGKP